MTTDVEQIKTVTSHSKSLKTIMLKSVKVKTGTEERNVVNTTESDNVFDMKLLVTKRNKLKKTSPKRVYPVFVNEKGS